MTELQDIPKLTLLSQPFETVIGNILGLCDGKMFCEEKCTKFYLYLYFKISLLICGKNVLKQQKNLKKTLQSSFALDVARWSNITISAICIIIYSTVKDNKSTVAHGLHEESLKNDYL